MLQLKGKYTTAKLLIGAVLTLHFSFYVIKPLFISRQNEKKLSPDSEEFATQPKKPPSYLNPE